MVHLTNIDDFCLYLQSEFSLSQENVEHFLTCFSIEEFEKGHVHFSEGQPVSKVYICLSGYGKAFSTTDDGTEHVIRFVKPCDGVNLFQESDASTVSETTFQSVTRSTMLVASRAEYLQMFEENSTLLGLQYKMMERSLFRFSERVRKMLVLTPQERYLQLQGEEPELERCVGLGNVASYLGITNVSLSRIRKRLLLV